MGSLKKNALALIILQGINYIIPLITLPYLVRVLGPTEYGNVGIAFSIIQYAILFTDFGFNLSISRKIAQNQTNKMIISELYTNTIFTKLGLAIFSAFIVCLLVLSIPKLYDIRYIIFCGYLQVIASVFVPIWFYQGIEKASTYSFISIAVKLLIIPLTFIFVKDKNDGDISLLIQGGVLFLTAIISIIHIFKQRYIKFVYPKLDIMISLFKEASPIFLGTVAVSLYTLSTPLILGMMSSAEQVGFYSAADKLRGAFLGIFLVLGGVLYPRVSRLFSEDEAKAFAFLKKLLINAIVVLSCSSVIFYFFSAEIAGLILGKQYLGSKVLIQIMSPMILLIPLSVILSNYILLALGHSRLFAKVPLITLFCHLSYSLFLSAEYGAIGASIAILITELVSFSILFSINLKKGYIKKVIFA